MIDSTFSDIKGQICYYVGGYQSKCCNDKSVRYDRLDKCCKSHVPEKVKYDR